MLADFLKWYAAVEAGTATVVRCGERDSNNRTNDFTPLKLYPLQLVLRFWLELANELTDGRWM